jgi:saccharopine dehydrogenase-like NADP-dependent oxidoreductase
VTSVAVVGLGAVGARAARQLASTPRVDRILLSDVVTPREDEVLSSLGEPDRIRRGDPDGADVVILATPAGDHLAAARRALAAGSHVVSVGDDPLDVTALLALDGEARAADRSVVIGAGFSPGFTCVLARHGADGFDSVDEIHVAKFGTGGPACARSHHRALTGESLDWWNGAWRRRPGGSGRELCWFPDPVGAQDCYRAAAPDALLLVPAFPRIARVTGRIQATRRDRLTSHLPMLRKPHPEGTVGAVRVEIRGQRGAARDVAVLGAVDRPAVAAGTVAALAALAVAEGTVARRGAAGLAELVDPRSFLTALAERGVRAALFEGAAA